MNSRSRIICNCCKNRCWSIMEGELWKILKWLVFLSSYNGFSCPRSLYQRLRPQEQRLSSLSQTNNSKGGITKQLLTGRRKKRKERRRWRRKRRVVGGREEKRTRKKKFGEWAGAWLGLAWEHMSTRGNLGRDFFRPHLCCILSFVS